MDYTNRQLTTLVINSNTGSPTPATINAAFLVGHSTLRVASMDTLDRAASAREITAMRGMLEEGLGAGA